MFESDDFKVKRETPGRYVFYKKNTIGAVITKIRDERWYWRIHIVPDVRPDGTIYSGRVCGYTHTLKSAVNHLKIFVFNDEPFFQTRTFRGL